MAAVNDRHHRDMEDFEGLLLNHRRVLIAYMEEWSKQQESILSRYACCSEDGKHEVVLHTIREAQKMAPNTEDFGGLFCERDLCRKRPPSGEDVAPGNHVTNTRVALETVPLPHASFPPSIDAQKLPTAAELQRITADMSSTLGTSASVSLQRRKPPRSCIERFVESSEFGFAISIAILSNALFMAIAADQTLQSAQTELRPREAHFYWGEIVFTCIYTVELFLKLIAYRSRFFCGSESKWNIFDLAVVISAAADLLAPLFLGDAINVSYLRVNRLIKLVKMMRVVKVYRTFKELRLIIASILGCVRTMFWAIVLLLTVLFSFSLLFIEGVTEYVKVIPPDEWNPDIMPYWGSTTTAMLSLFQSSTGGEDWSQVADPLWDIGWAYYAAFALYICFFLFIVVNILAAMFVEAAMGHSIQDEKMVSQEGVENKHAHIRKMKALYRRLDHDGSGQLSWDDFAKELHSLDMRTFASDLEIDVSDIQEFFRLISSDGRDVVDLENFVVGCMKLKGYAKSLDVASLIEKTRHLEHATAAFENKTDGHLQEVKRMLNRVLYEQEHAKKPFLAEHAAAKEPLWEEHTATTGGISNMALSISPRRFSSL